MKRRLPLLCLVLLACAGVRAEWLTLNGSPGDAGNTYVQVDPTSVEVNGSRRSVTVRMNLAEDRTSKDGVRFRSVLARASVDCEARSAHYLSATYFGHPNFVGEPVAVKEFGEDDVRPMLFAGAPGELVGRTVNAACRVGAPR